MRTITLAFAIILIISQDLLAQNEQTNMDSLSYSIGLLMGQNLKAQGFDGIDATSMAAAVEDVLAGNDYKVPQDEAQALVNTYAQKMQEKKTKAAKEGGDIFLAQNKTKAGVTTTASGLQYEVITAGEGVSPGPTDKVNVHYHGTLVDGSVFDSSVDRGEPISFPVNGVIQGWQEALQLMKVGDKWRVFIPSDLGYGARGAGAKIPPHSTLIFEVELLGIE